MLILKIQYRRNVIRARLKNVLSNREQVPSGAKARILMRLRAARLKAAPFQSCYLQLGFFAKAQRPTTGLPHQLRRRLGGYHDLGMKQSSVTHMSSGGIVLPPLSLREKGGRLGCRPPGFGINFSERD